jgi:hypothetical protein
MGERSRSVPVRADLDRGLDESAAATGNRVFARGEQRAVLHLEKREREEGAVGPSDHTVVSPNICPMNAACPALSFFANHLTCPLR